MRGDSPARQAAVVALGETPSPQACPLERIAGTVIPAATADEGTRLARQAEADRRRFFAQGCPPDVQIVGQSEGIRKALEAIRLVAESPCNPVLIVGETGTGKELAAQALHALRGGTPDTFVAVNFAGLTANLLESELFGHVKGAFTGADADKMGLFELAGSGTFLLDEISEMPLELQAKLLRVLQEKSFRKVGGTQTIPCAATIIASSNRDLAAGARGGQFRRDLYYRLTVFPVHLPPLRAPERREDVPLLADYFVLKAAETGRVRAASLSPAAKEHLSRHIWPGNVRELRNVVERATILARSDEIGPEDLTIDNLAAPPDGATGMRLPEDDFSLETAERLFITRALQETGWQRTRAAALLGITRATLHAKLRRYQIKAPEEAAGLGTQADPSVRSFRLQEPVR